MNIDGEIKLENVKIMHHKNGLAIIPNKDSIAVMSADDMFEQLGYEKEYYRADDITYSLKSEDNKYDKNYITFYFDSEIVYVDKSISMQELKAINKKVKELGWKV